MLLSFRWWVFADRSGLERLRPVERDALPARIDAGHGLRLLNCVIDDLSKFIARTTLAIDAKLPKDFVLVLSAQGDVRRHCHTLRRDGLELDVQFLPDGPKDQAAIVEPDG